MKLLVTGAGGFVGEFLVRRLLATGAQVRGTVRNNEAAKRLEALGAEPVFADLNDKDSLQRALKDIDRVFHIAALFRQAGLPSSEFYRVNVEGTRNLLECVIHSKVDRVIHCSTIGVLGHVEHPPADENTPYNPGDHYQISKMEGEKLFLDYVKSGKIKGSVIRPAMIYGPGDTRTLKLFKQIAKKRFFYVGPGDSLVHFIDVRDLAEAFYLAGERSDIDGEIFIIGGETSLPLEQLVRVITSIMGVPAPWLHLPIKPMQTLGSLCEALCTPLKINPPIYRRRVDFFTKDRHFDCSKAKEVLGFRPARSLLQELVEIINFYVTSGAINRALIRKPSAMIRRLDGEIHSWDSDAERIYGWPEADAVRRFSHSLLNTQFPEDLAKINAHLESRGFWEGSLVHKDRAGNNLKIFSKWKLFHPAPGLPPFVLELNTPINKESERKGETLPFTATTAALLASECRALAF